MIKRVLLIEDEPNIIEALRFLLNRDGWAVDTHSDGATAVQAVEARNPDVIVLDVMLPHRSGYDILRELRSSDNFRDTPVLMLTARGQEKDREMAMAIGANHFMTKPFSNTEVIETIRAMAGL